MNEDALVLLRNLSVLVVEDEPLVAMSLVDELERADAFVVGPAVTVGDAMELVHKPQLGAAILDIEMQGETVYPAADVLIDRAVPFIFATGLDAAVLPGRFAAIPNCPKPAPAIDVVALLARRLAELR